MNIWINYKTDKIKSKKKIKIFEKYTFLSNMQKYSK